MKNAVLITDVDGKPHVLILSTVTGCDVEPGEPGEPAVPAQEAVEGEPGEPASDGNPGKPPVEAKPAVEAKEAVPAKPETVIIHREGGEDIKLQTTRAAVVELLNGGI
jgi:hypothetical protein